MNEDSGINCEVSDDDRKVEESFSAIEKGSICWVDV